MLLQLGLEVEAALDELEAPQGVGGGELLLGATEALLHRVAVRLRPRFGLFASSASR